MSDIERERFESWFKTTTFFIIISNLYEEEDDSFSRNGLSDNYADDDIQNSWAAWQAAKQDGAKTCEWSLIEEDGDYLSGCVKDDFDRQHPFCPNCGGKVVKPQPPMGQS